MSPKSKRKAKRARTRRRAPSSPGGGSGGEAAATTGTISLFCDVAVQGNLEGCANNTGVVLQLGRHDLGAQLQVREVLVRALGDATAHDEEFRGEQELHVGEVALEEDAVFLPAQSIAFAGDGRGLGFG